MYPLALASGSEVWDSARGIIGWSLVILVGAFAVLLVGIYWRRRVLNTSQSPPEPWTLDDLRMLRDQGAVSEDEYERLRAALIRAFQGQDAPPDGVSGVDTPREPEWDWVSEDAPGPDDGSDGPGFDVKKSREG